MPIFEAYSKTVSIEPVYSNLFDVISENSKGETLDDIYLSFVGYEKILFGRETFIKLTFGLAENRRIFDCVADVKKITVNGNSKNGDVYLKQIFIVEYVNYTLAQDYNVDGLLNVTFQYKILDQEVMEYDVS